MFSIPEPTRGVYDSPTASFMLIPLACLHSLVAVSRDLPCSLQPFHTSHNAQREMDRFPRHGQETPPPEQTVRYLAYSFGSTQMMSRMELIDRPD
jgi:hypothetical protein